MPSKTASAPDEDAVRRYLVFLTDPAALVDTREAARLERELAGVSDPVDRLKLLSRIERALHVDGVQLRAGFVAAAKRFAEAEQIPPSAFLTFGVPRQVLSEAGLLTGAGGRSSRAGARHQVTGPVVAAAARRMGRPFTARDLETRSGASALTTRRVLDEMVAAGELADAGPDPQHRGRGRVPRRFQPA